MCVLNKREKQKIWLKVEFRCPSQNVSSIKSPKRISVSQSKHGPFSPVFFSAIHFSKTLTFCLSLIHIQKVLILLQRVISSGNWAPLGQTWGYCNSPSEVWATSLGPSAPLVVAHLCSLFPRLLPLFSPTRILLFLSPTPAISFRWAMMNEKLSSPQIRLTISLF